MTRLKNASNDKQQQQQQQQTKSSDTHKKKSKSKKSKNENGKKQKQSSSEYQQHKQIITIISRLTFTIIFRIPTTIHVVYIKHMLVTQVLAQQMLILTLLFVC